jgi:16S rRNA (guanine(966)-N(2))-methyltransferase RsmD
MRSTRTRPAPAKRAIRLIRRPAGAGAAHQVRIIGGLWRQTRIPVATVPGLRPTPDRVRVTVFNWLAHLLPDPGRASALDMYAGTGALGLELASRGARRVVLVEIEPGLAARLQALCERLGAGSGAVAVVVADALRYAAGLPAASFDVIFVDPPFDSGLLWPSLAAAGRLLAASGLVYAESAARLDAAQLAAAGMRVQREGRAGRVHYYLLRRVEQ